MVCLRILKVCILPVPARFTFSRSVVPDSPRSDALTAEV